MKEIKGNIWELAKNEIICITTNGDRKKNGQAIMGKGIAKEAKDRWMFLPIWLGEHIKENGNTVCSLGTRQFGENWYKLYSFPTKHHWYEKSDINLIEQSAKRLVKIVEGSSNDPVYIPRPGCGNGQLDWETEVKPVIETILIDDRFIIVSKEE